MIEFTVPGQPRPKVTKKDRQGRIYTTPSTKEYQARVATYAAQAMASGPWPIMEAGVAVACEMIFFLRRPKGCPKDRVYPTVKPDDDNYGKACADGMSGVVFADDRQIVHRVIGLRYARGDRGEEPRTLLRLWVAGTRGNESSRKRVELGPMDAGHIETPVHTRVRKKNGVYA